MNKKIWRLRVAYWTAAIADFVVAASVLIPSRMGVEHYVYPMGLISAVAFSWGVMLVIADRDPYERRWVLIPTMVVVVLLGAVGIQAGISGVLPIFRIIPTSIVAIIVLSVLIYSYLYTRDRA